MEKEWVIETIEQIALFGKGSSGITRLAFSQADQEAREYVMQLMRDMGLRVQVDKVGNVTGRMEGTNKEAPAVITGSHLDTVPEGGKYDGVVGVVGGLAALKRLKERQPLTHSLELIIFAAEESSRFGLANIGSKALTGMANMYVWNKAKDQAGVLLSRILAEQGLKMGSISSAVRPHQEMKAFIELHIEQGRVLERAKDQIGIIEAVAAPTRLKITVEGMAAHSGATPMDERQDALVSAAMIILAVREIALEQSDYGTVGTVGVLTVHPGAMNVIPGLVEMFVDIRGVDHESIIQTLQDIKDAVITIADGQETPVAIEVLSSEKPVEMHPDMIRTIEESCRKTGIAYQFMTSRAGHDAMNMAHVIPAGMIFIPCRNGISHNPDEYAAIEDIMTGIDVLTETLYQIAK